MADKPTDEDLVVAKQAALEIMMLTLVRPLAANPKFWADIDALADAFEQMNQDVLAAFPQRWGATRGFLTQWRKALNPGG